MKQRLIRIVKKYKLVYMLYRFFMSILVCVMKLFYRKQDKLILFVGNGGRKFGDNVAPIYIEMLKDERFKDWTFVWAFSDPEKYSLPDKTRTELCKIDTLGFFAYALKSRCWITNISVQRGLSFKRKNTVYINTWHGVPMKLLGFDNVKGYSFNNKEAETFDLMIAAGDYDYPIMKSAFRVKNDNVKITGYPRNDILYSCDRSDVNRKTRKELNVNEESQVILYAPTYRDYKKNTNGDVTFDLPISIDKFSSMLPQYTLWIRMHELTDVTDYSDKNIVDVTKYESNYNLMISADILISDYSGIIFEFALLEKPIIIFAYDYEEYKEKRGLYVDIEKDFPFHVSRNENDLMNYISTMNYNEECLKTKYFKKKYGLVEGNATKRVVDEIYKLV